MDFRNSPAPGVGPLLDAARKEWIDTLLESKKSLMQRHPELSKAAVLETITTKERLVLWWKKDTLYCRVAEMQEKYLPRKGEHEILWTTDTTEPIRYHTWDSVQWYIDNSLRGTRTGWRITQLNALQIEMYRLNKELFPDGGRRLLDADDLDQFRHQAEHYWKDDYPQYMALFDEIDMRQRQFNKLSNQRFPDFIGALREDYPGLSLRDLIKQQFHGLCGAEPDYELKDVNFKRARCRKPDSEKWTRRNCNNRDEGLKKPPREGYEPPAYTEREHPIDRGD